MKIQRQRINDKVFHHHPPPVLLLCLKHLKKLDKDKPMKMKGKNGIMRASDKCVGVRVRLFEHMSLKKSERVKRLHVLVRKQAKRPFQLSTKNTIYRCDVQTTTDNPFYFIFNSGSTLFPHFYVYNSITLYDYSMRLGVEWGPPGWLMRIAIQKGEDDSGE